VVSAFRSLMAAEKAGWGTRAIIFYKKAKNLMTTGQGQNKSEIPTTQSSGLIHDADDDFCCYEKFVL